MPINRAIEAVLSKFEEQNQRDYSGYKLYGSACRPLYNYMTWNISGIFLQVSPKSCGFYTIIATPKTLERDIVEQYELSSIER